jgi:hypothetical protein
MPNAAFAARLGYVLNAGGGAAQRARRAAVARGSCSTMPPPDWEPVMHTELYPNKTAAVYPDGDTAEAAAMAVDAADLENVSVLRLAPGDSTVEQAIEPETGATRNTVARDTLSGGAAGTAAGVAAAGTLAVTAPALFVSAPVPRSEPLPVPSAAFGCVQPCSRAWFGMHSTQATT